MKKYITVAALLAAGTACANASEITPLIDAQSGTWSNHGTIGINDGVLSSTNPNWQVDCATYTLTTALSISTDETLKFSFDATNNGTGNSCLTLALIGSSCAIVIGHGTYSSPADGLQVAVTDNTTSVGGYVFAATNPGDDVQLTAGATLASAMPANGATSTISGQIVWDGDSWYLTAKSSATSDSLSYDLGITSLDVSKLAVTIEGGRAPNDVSADWQTPTMSNLKIAVVPEPSAFGMLAGLGALALVASRRRVKKA